MATLCRFANKGGRLATFYCGVCSTFLSTFPGIPTTRCKSTSLEVTEGQCLGLEKQAGFFEEWRRKRARPASRHLCPDTSGPVNAKKNKSINFSQPGLFGALKKN